MNICVFGSSSNSVAPIYKNAALELGRALALQGHTLVFGGYDMGLMGAVAAGAAEMGGPVVGVITNTLEGSGRAVFPCTEVISSADLTARKTKMIEMSDAFVTMPGGLGTFDEFFTVMSLVKAGESHAKSALYNVAEYFNPLIRMLEDSCEKGLNSTDWRDSCNAFTNPDELIAWLEA